MAEKRTRNLLIRLALILAAGLAAYGLIQYSSYTRQGFVNQFDRTYPVHTSPEELPEKDASTKPSTGSFYERLALAAEERTRHNVRYDPSYVKLRYPGGDVPPGTGVCTDVVIRSYRALGIDLQKEVHEDMKANFSVYPRIWRLSKPDTNIDHRRVPNLMTFFKRHGTALEKSRDAQDYRAGDIVTWDLGRGITHIGIVTTKQSADKKRFLISHNIGAGPQLEDVLFGWKIIGHFRYGENKAVSIPKQPERIALPESMDRRTIHVFVALCDNDSQGIVPVSRMLGNGNDPKNNLYWGAMYGVRTFLRKSRHWKLMQTLKNPDEIILERCVFRHASGKAFLVADAYRGSRIKNAVTDFLKSAAGQENRTIECSGKRLGINGSSELAVYVGHNGLMDFAVVETAPLQSSKPVQCVVLACKSRPYFEKRLSEPLLLTTGLMAPEAYTLEAVLEGWIRSETPAQLRERAARAYSKYQKCGLNAARNLFYAVETNSR